jgi:dTDP-4-dehydrorhamnose reductase
MKLVVLGADGMLGRAVRELCAKDGHIFEGYDRPSFDLCAEADVERVIAGGADAVLNCAAYTNVDGAEADEATATRINGDAVAQLARIVAKRNIPLVHYSTDYVFRGDASAPYPTDTPHDPLNAYGRGKAVGERGVWDAGGPHLVLRTSWLYAPWANNFVRTIAKASRDRPELRVVNDQHGRPTSAEHLARTTLALLQKSARGTLHVTDGGACTWFEFAREIVRLSGHAAQVVPCTSAEFLRPAKRPAYSVLDLGPTEAIVGTMPDWHANLADVMARLEPL